MPGPRTIATLVSVPLLLGAGGLLGALSARRLWAPSDGTPLHVTATEASAAMADDHYFADYGRRAVLLTGVVDVAHQSDANTAQQGLVLRAGRRLPVRCWAFDGPSLAPGATVTVEAHDAERAGDAVVYAACRYVAAAA